MTHHPAPRPPSARFKTALCASMLATICSLSMSYATPSWADDSAASTSGDAGELFEQGKALFAAGKFRESREAYLKAYSLRRSYDIAANLGNVEAQLGRWAAAAEHLTFALNNLPPTLDAATRNRAQTKMQQRLAEAARYIGTLKLTVEPAGSTVLLDGKEVGLAPLNDSIFLEPGRHVIEVQLAGHQSKSQAVQMDAGANRQLLLALESSGDGGPSLPLVIAGGGVAAAAIGTGIAMLVLSGAKGSDRQTLVGNLASSSECAPGGAIAPSCSEIQSLADDQRLFQGIGIGMLIGGGVVAAGTLTYAFWPRQGDDGADKAAIRFAPIAGPDVAGAIIWGAF